MAISFLDYLYKPSSLDHLYKYNYTPRDYVPEPKLSASIVSDHFIGQMWEPRNKRCQPREHIDILSLECIGLLTSRLSAQFPKRVQSKTWSKRVRSMLNFGCLSNNPELQTFQWIWEARKTNNLYQPQYPYSTWTKRNIVWNSKSSPAFSFVDIVRTHPLDSLCWVHSMFHQF